MTSRADYRNVVCDCTEEFWFDGTPPSVHTAECSVHPKGPESHPKATKWYRVWTPMHTGRGSSGEPPR